jgi:hypothetical protein
LQKSLIMTLKAPQYITNEKGKKTSVILSIQDYETLIALAEDAEDVQLYDEVKSRNEERISLEDYVKRRKTNAL